MPDNIDRPGFYSQSNSNAYVYYERSTHNRWIALLLCLFLGLLGIHRFYVGKVWTGLLQMLTGGGFVVWTVVDFILILFGFFRDSEGRRLL